MPGSYLLYPAIPVKETLAVLEKDPKGNAHTCHIRHRLSVFPVLPVAKLFSRSLCHLLSIGQILLSCRKFLRDNLTGRVASRHPALQTPK